MVEPAAPASAQDNQDDIALSALRQYNHEAKNARVFARIPKFMGGTIHLVEFDDPDGRQEWSVLVRDGTATVF